MLSRHLFTGSDPVNAHGVRPCSELVHRRRGHCVRQPNQFLEQLQLRRWLKEHVPVLRSPEDAYAVRIDLGLSDKHQLCVGGVLVRSRGPTRPDRPEEQSRWSLSSDENGASGTRRSVSQTTLRQHSPKPLSVGRALGPWSLTVLLRTVTLGSFLAVARPSSQESADEDYESEGDSAEYSTSRSRHPHIRSTPN
jgi:hypothetical protein